VNSLPSTPVQNGKKNLGSYDPEKSLPPSRLTAQFATLDERPSIPSIINNIVANAGKEERLGIVACSPRGMVADVRKSVADNLRVEGPALEFWSESFGW
jgi:hypothetical protein